MATNVKCQLILEAADDNLSSNGEVTAGVFPNRALYTVPAELYRLVDRTQNPPPLLSDDPSEYEYRELVCKLVHPCGPGFEVDPRAHSSGSIESRGVWIHTSSSAYAFGFSKDGRPYVERRPEVAPNCVCRYLVSIQPL